MGISEERKNELIREIEKKSKDGNFPFSKILELPIQDSMELHFVSEYLISKQVVLKNDRKTKKEKQKAETYEYMPSEEEIPEERKEQLKAEIDDYIWKGHIAHHKILYNAKNDAEYQFLYDYLVEKGIVIRGINTTISGEISGFEHIPKTNQSYMPERLSPEEEMKLWEKMATAGEEETLEIRNKLVESNMRLARWVVGYKKLYKLGLEKEDIESAAMIGLINAVEGYDYTLGYKFSTYAVVTMVNTVLKECKPKGTRPLYDSYLRKISRIEDMLAFELDREPTNEDIAKILNVSESKVEKIRNYGRLKDVISFEGLMEDLRSSNIDEYIGEENTILDDENRVYLEGIIEPNEEEPEDFITDMLVGEEEDYFELKDMLDDVLDILEPNEKLVIELRFGFKDGNPKTLAECGDIFRVSRTRIEQIEKIALRKLYKPSKRKNLQDFIDMDTAPFVYSTRKSEEKKDDGVDI